MCQVASELASDLRLPVGVLICAKTLIVYVFISPSLLFVSSLPPILLSPSLPPFPPTLLTGLSPDLQSMEQIRRIMRPTDVPDQGLLCDLLWADPDKETMGWGENDRGVSFTFGPEIVSKFLAKHDLDLITRAHQVSVPLFLISNSFPPSPPPPHSFPLFSSQVVEDGYEFFAKRQLVTLFSAPNYCGEFDNAGAMMSVDETLMCSFQVRGHRAGKLTGYSETPRLSFTSVCTVNHGILLRGESFRCSWSISYRECKV